MGAKKLWLYNLHYFDDLNAREGERRLAWHVPLIRRWIDENPPSSGIGWDPYPTSLRIVNWIKWALGGGPLPEEAVRSLAVQARHLERRLEYHLLGNHLFANAKALVFAGFFFEGTEGERWLRKGLDLLEHEVPEQVLPDGGHFERSPMYHSLVLEDLLDLINLRQAYTGEDRDRTRGLAVRWSETVPRMRKWLSAMCHPDGEISLFNDAAFGIAPTPEELNRYAERLGFGPASSPGEGVTHLKDSGYIRLQGSDVVLLLDVGPLGPDYLTGHGHADTLSFELSLYGRRAIVDTGVSLYDLGTERLFQRGTTAHNTVTVDGAGSSDVWGSFRVARRANPFGLEIQEKAVETIVRCSHDGFYRLPGKVTHRRKWRLRPEGLTIEDVLEGKFRRAQGGILLNPSISLETRGGFAETGAASAGTWVLPPGKTVRWKLSGGAGRLESASYHPRFGVSMDTLRLVYDFDRDRCSLDLVWE